LRLGSDLPSSPLSLGLIYPPLLHTHNLLKNVWERFHERERFHEGESERAFSPKYEEYVHGLKNEVIKCAMPVYPLYCNITKPFPTPIAFCRDGKREREKTAPRSTAKIPSSKKELSRV
jgi:hypothetical protein